MKKVSKTMAIVLCLAMILSLTALAAWPTYQGDNAHTGQITDAAPYIANGGSLTVGSHLKYTTLPTSGSGWSGVDSEPLMQKESDGVTYAYVMYNGHAVNGGRIAKVSCSTGSVVWTKQVTTTAANQLSTPLLVGNALYYVYNVETRLGTASLNNAQSSSQTISITTTLSAGGSYRLYAPSYTSSGGSTSLEVKVTKPDNTTVYLNVDNNDPAETGSSTSHALSTDSADYLNKNYADVFSAAGTYTIDFIYTVSSGSYYTGTCAIYKNTVTLSKIDDVTVSSNPTITPIATNLIGSGQMNTPVTTDGEYIYFGTWLSAKANGEYYQVDIRSGQTYGTVKNYLAGTGYGFYWAGAAPIDVNGDGTNDYIVFGGDGGYLYYRSISNFDSTTVGGVYDLSALGNVTAGNVRSTISSDGTYIYLTSQGPTGTSYLWRFLISTIGNTTPTFNVIALDGGTSTSTPAISLSNNLIYVGYYNGFTSGGIDVVKSNSSTFAIVKNISSLPPVQSSIDVYSDLNNGYDYVFYTTNANAGGGYCYRVSTTSPYTATEMWNTASEGNNTCLQGMAACNGYLTFGNDSNRFFIVNP